MTTRRWETSFPEVPHEDLEPMPSTSGRSGGGHGPFRCRDCDWTGGADSATAHHQASRHHSIENRWGHVQRFSCCARLGISGRASQPVMEGAKE